LVATHGRAGRRHVRAFAGRGRFAAAGARTPGSAHHAREQSSGEDPSMIHSLSLHGTLVPSEDAAAHALVSARAAARVTLVTIRRAAPAAVRVVLAPAA